VVHNDAMPCDDDASHNLVHITLPRDNEGGQAEAHEP